MQEHQLTGEAGRRAPSWYLSRGDKRYGPLADRELLLLAERGGLHTDDLLWKPGFTSWKSVQAVCGVNSLNSTLLRKSASPQDAEYLPTCDAGTGLTEIAEAAAISGPTLPKANELEASEGDEPERVLRELELAPDRKLLGRIHNQVAWTLAFSLGTFVVALGIFWLIATGNPSP
jgi:GYF domain 2